MESVGFFSYLIAGGCFLLLLLLMSTTSIKQLNSKILFMAVIATATWCFFTSYSIQSQKPLIFSFIFETVKNLLLGLLCINLLLKKNKFLSLIATRNKFSLFYFLIIFSLFCLTLNVYLYLIPTQLIFIAQLTQSIALLIMIEYLYRQGSSEFKWGFKPLAFTIAGFAIFDLILYSSAVLLSQINLDMFWLRGAFYILLSPILVIGIKRQESLGLRIFISREVVFHSTLLLGISLYLLTMGATGYYLKINGGHWGVVSQLLFTILALAILVLLFINQPLKNKIKVFIDKHFFANRYNYRQQWINLNNSLSEDSSTDYKYVAINAITQLFKMKHGALFIIKKDKPIMCNATTLDNFTTESKWVDFIASYQKDDKQWIIDIDEYERYPEVYPQQLTGLDAVLNCSLKIVVPIIHQNALFGYFLLSRPSHNEIVNYEDRDLLFTAGQQLANFLALNQANRAILEASQFTAFNRMSAFLVHDLKNIAAQLELTSANAQKFKHNPEFIDDTFETIEHASKKINNMLSQLRTKQSQQQQRSSINLKSFLKEIINKVSYTPVPQLIIDVNEGTNPSPNLYLEPEKLTNIILHLIKNAQDACHASLIEGESSLSKESMANHSVTIALKQTVKHWIISIKDSGVGMTQDFIEHRLFKPFDTTKGNAGMGIGAYEAKHYIEDIGGQLEIDSIEHQGTCINLLIPQQSELVPNKDSYYESNKA
ncbi:XrtA/PEP-CTERM system histidine kinase PrsK [Psychrobium sp. 1_MG-2023]|uniref:XrtA/PEP-CTERM system histidine kinase PrsK n=1 Tax=Psychrobium sp. 1_MG-2023 TaxID=3062624 RepID=UPI000C32D6CD|nr:XrtA/PEP-CTERM system histidine kinase PrsK [Psychrobium sp. 1_MG-2023]MDP2561118.1 PEP-CTERM system histidine kinase PrsK [Psychrobium sp. 1_MG-2023]PKF55094.1 PEP-CTERM system histidine kinase PrsK [Alteromonadales bacterium alter-6D02]